jgi:uncharacterized protein involved in tolerance to divalent cations
MCPSVLVAIPDPATAKKIDRTMVERGLATCMNVREVRSVHRGSGEVLLERKAVMLFKVTEEGFEALCSAVLEAPPNKAP